MRRLRLFGAFIVPLALIAGTVVGIQLALATAQDDVQHGISFTKGCTSPTSIGQPYSCSYTVRNNIDDAGDTLTISGLVDTVHAQGGDSSSGNVFGSLSMTGTGGASCTGGTGNGTSGSPWNGATFCTLPFGSRINILSFSDYTVRAADFTLPGHILADSANLTWNDLCNGTLAGVPGGGNCNPNPPPSGAASQSTVQQLPSTTSTAIHNSAHAIVTTVAAGAVVHDFVTVAPATPGNPVPTGQVSLTWFTDGTCGASSASHTETLTANGTVEATDFTQGPLGPGQYSFQANYLGDPSNPVYAPSTGACEPLTVVDANIQIAPPTATNRVGSNHVLTCHVNVNPGNGFVNAPDGTMCTVAITGGPGQPTSQSCSTGTPTPGSGSCNVTITSSQTGVSAIQASTSVTVGGVPLSRSTGDGLAGDGANAQKTWVDAKISIAPDATNEVGQSHTFTVTVLKDTGTGTFVPAAGEHVDFTLTDSNGAAHTSATGTCTNPGANTDPSGQCTIVFTSPTAGKVTANATSTLTVAGLPILVSTDGTFHNSGPAVKTFVDANIQITPNGTNRVGQSHTFIAHVNVNDGSGAGFQPAPDGTSISFTKDSGPGTLGAPNPCTTSGGTGSCQITLTSAATGLTTVSAHTTVSLGGLLVHRDTNGSAGNSGPALKTWVDAAISIAPSATNEVGHPHTFTVTVTKDLGAGPVAAANEPVTVTLTPSNGAAPSPAGPITGVTDATGHFQVTFTSPTAGQVVAHATASLADLGTATPVEVATDGTGNNSGDATKTFVDANIAIAPNGTNRVGQPHTFTAHVTVNDGSGGGFVDAPAGTQISFTIDNGPGTFTPPNPCVVVSGGSCQVTLNSTLTGVTTVSAHTTLSVGGVSLTRSTDGTAGNSGPATKRWVDAAITIAPSATNEVNHPHTFTVTVTKDTGNGAGPVPAPNEPVTVTLTPSNGAAPSPAGPVSGLTNASGQFPVTITSPSAGKVVAHASATLSDLGTALPITVQTDGTGSNSGNATKTFVDANISISPSGTNRVGNAHTFTAAVAVDDGSGVGFKPAPDGTTVTFTIDSDTAASTPNPPTSCTTTGGTCQTTINSASTGVTVVSAHTTVTVGGQSITRNTDGTGTNSGPATKTWVNARIAITPDATNRAGQPHTFHVTLMKDTGTGVFAPAPGEHVDVTLSPTLGAAISGPVTGSCTNAGPNTDANGMCDITFSSNSTGKIDGHATSTLSVGGSAPFTVQTDGLLLNSGDAVKTYVDAKISIAPDATNEVGQPHTFTVTLQKDLGDGNSFVAAAGETVTVTLTPSNGAAPSPAGPFTLTTDAAGHAQVTFTSASPGQVKAHASATLSLGPPPPAMVHVETDGTGFNSGDATKTYVDANIQISPQSATNPVGANHVLTGHVNVNDGSGAGYVSAPDGTTINFSVGNAGGATATFVGPSSCTTSGGTGSCQVTISSPTAGSTSIHASTNVMVGGVSLARATGDTLPSDSPDASKTWASAKISIAPTATNEVGQSHTFTVTLQKDTGGGFQPAAGEHVDVTLTDANGAIHSGTTGSCLTAGANTDSNGQCTVTFTSFTGGTVTGHATSTLDFGGGVHVTVATDGTGGNSLDAVKTFVDANIQITPATATNRIGSPHVLTAHLNIDSGDGQHLHNAPDGTTITFTKTGPGTLSSTSCTTTGGTGSCSVTLTSGTTGVTNVSAHWTGTLAGKTVTRSTDGTGLNSGPASKTWVDARISIAPAATNEVGHPHTFTVTLEKDLGNGAGFVGAANEHVDVALSDSNGAVHTSPTGTCTNPGVNTDASGQCTITFTSNTAGKVTGSATATLSDLGTTAPVTVQTDGVGQNSGVAVKTFVDAFVTITPNGTNPINSTHTFTAHVGVNTGDGNGFVNTPAGTQISFSIDSGPGSFTTTNPCTVVSGGSCQITLTSSLAGTTVVSAHVTTSVGGVSLTRVTNGVGANSSPATKVWVAAKISIAQSATNEVGHSHTFTVTLQKDSGSGYGPAANEHVDVTLTDAGGASHGTPTGSCTTGAANTDVNGQCTITFVSNTAGTVTGHATSTLTVGGKPLTVSTGSGAPNSADAVKTYVDANISISPSSATNRVGSAHTLTGHVNVNTGGGAFANAPAGTLITFSITSGSATFVAGNTCTTIGTTGSCTVQINSTSTGSNTIHATTTVTVGGVPLTRATGDTHVGDSADASKTYVNAKISITPSATNEVGHPHTFTVTLQKDTGTGTFVAAAGEHVTVALTDAGGASHGTPTGSCTTAGPNTDVNGQCTLTFVSNSAGTVTGHASATLMIGTPSTTFTVQTDGTGLNSADAVKTFVDANIQISPLTATNPIGTTHVLTLHVNVNPGTGFVNAPAGTTITASLTNSGGATATFVGGVNTCTTVGTTGSCTVTITSPTAGTTTIHATTTVVVGGITLTRATADGKPGDSADATKTWIGVTGKIAPTQETCQTYSNGTAATLGTINYTVNGNKIGQSINPGVFFFYSRITTTTPNQVVTVTQTNTSTNNAALFQVMQGQANLYTSSCGNLQTGTLTNNSSGTSFTVATPGTYVIGIKYSTKSIAGATPPVPANITYNFATSLGGTTGASVQLVKS
jgi:hypothetical protein